jgi:hypothetical protein
MTHTRNISRQRPTKAALPVFNAWLASILPNWPGTIFDAANLAYFIFVQAPLSKIFGFQLPIL